MLANMLGMRETLHVMPFTMLALMGSNRCLLECVIGTQDDEPQTFNPQASNAEAGVRACLVRMDMLRTPTDRGCGVRKLSSLKHQTGLVLFLFFVFGILGVQLFKGLFRGQ